MKNAWKSFKIVFEIFLGNPKDDNYKEIISDLLKNNHAMGMNMSHENQIPLSYVQIDTICEHQLRILMYTVIIITMIIICL